MSESKSFTYTSPWTGETETRYYHECLRCRKEYTGTFERGNSGWCSHRCQTLAMADVYKKDVLKAGEIMTSKHFELIHFHTKGKNCSRNYYLLQFVIVIIN